MGKKFSSPVLSLEFNDEPLETLLWFNDSFGGGSNLNDSAEDAIVVED
jgi:hypothetical protein